MRKPDNSIYGQQEHKYALVGQSRGQSKVMQALCDLTRLSAKAQEEPSSNSYSLSGGWSFYTLVSGREGYNYNLLPRQHHCTKEIWATFLDVAWVMGYISSLEYLLIREKLVFLHGCDKIWEWPGVLHGCKIKSGSGPGITPKPHETL